MPAFNCAIELRWGDCDQLGHINNVYYLEYAQEARLRYFRQWHDSGVHLGSVVVRRVEVDFDRSLLYSAAVIDIEVSIVRVGNSSFTMRHRIFDREGVLYASVDAVMVVVDLEAGVPRRLPDDVRKLLEENLIPA